VSKRRNAAAPLLRDLEQAGIGTEDFGRFVNRPIPGVLDPARFDEAAATPILLRWLPEMADRRVKESIVRHLKNKAARGVATDTLVAEFRVADDHLRWVIGDTLQAVATKHQYPTLVELAADERYGSGRAPLFDILWRARTDRAVAILRDSLADPDVALVAGSALRRAIGNEAARDHLAALVDHPDDVVRRAARENLARASRAIETRAVRSVRDRR
jgi:hypothetical protein